MPSTYSPNLRLELIGTGEQQGTWGSTTNVNLGTLLEEAIGGYVSVTVSDSGDTTLTSSNGASDQSRNMVINLVGTISAARTVLCPAAEKLYVVKNSTSGGFAITFKVSGQTGVTIANGSTVFVYVDNTDVRTITGTAASQNIGTSGANVPLLNGANTFSADQTFGDGSGAVNFTINGAAASTRLISVETAGSDRWAFGVNSVSETGSNAGSNFVVRRFDDTGVLQGTPVSINRATGVTTIDALDATGTPTAVNTAGYTNTNQIATTAHVYATVTRTPINYQTGTTYTIQLSDAGKLLLLDNAAAITLTIPTNASVALALDTRIDLTQWGAGQVTVVGAVGVTLAAAGSRTKTGERYGGCTLVKVNTDTWLLMGNTA